MAWSTAPRYSKNPEHVKDLVAVGKIGLMTAASRYELDRTNRFASYAQFWVLIYITNALSSVSIVIEVPARTLTDVRRGWYKGLDQDRAHMAVYGGVNLDAPIGSDADESSMTAMDLLECPRPNPQEAAENASEADYYREMLEKAFVDLTERERSIIVMRKLSEEQKTSDEVARATGS
jgi:RNA polymerase sigma-32 factor